MLHITSKRNIYAIYFIPAQGNPGMLVQNQKEGSFPVIHSLVWWLFWDPFCLPVLTLQTRQIMPVLSRAETSLPLQPVPMQLIRSIFLPTSTIPEHQLSAANSSILGFRLAFCFFQPCSIFILRPCRAFCPGKLPGTWVRKISNSSDCFLFPD